jgi:uncharacterized membrane protein
LAGRLRKERPRGLYVVTIGFIWSAVFAVIGIASGSLLFNHQTLIWGLSSGLFGAASNLIFIHVLRHMHVGVAATIYRLNLAPAALFAFLFLNEDATPFKLLGITAAIGAVLLFLPKRSPDHQAHIARGYFLLIIIANLLRAGMGITYKIGMTSGANRNAFLVLNGLAWMISGLIYFFTNEGCTTPNPKKPFSMGLGPGR